jgi:hypothetical protein
MTYRRLITGNFNKASSDFFKNYLFPGFSTISDICTTISVLFNILDLLAFTAFMRVKKCLIIPFVVHSVLTSTSHRTEWNWKLFYITIFCVTIQHSDHSYLYDWRINFAEVNTDNFICSQQYSWTSINICITKTEQTFRSHHIHS